MKSKLFLLISLSFIFLFMVVGVQAVECNTSTTNANGYYIINSSSISDGCTLDDDGVGYIMSGETFYLNGSTGGAVAINNHNIVLNCNGTTLNGNRSEGANSYVGIFTNYDNITIKNCILSDYDRAIRTFTSAENDTIYNNTIYNSTYGIMISKGYANVSSNKIINSTAFSVYLSGVSNNILDNNEGYGATYSYFYLLNSFDNNFTNNKLYKSNNLVFHEAVHLASNSSNNYFYNNTLTDTNLYAFRIEYSDSNIFTNNTIKNTDRGFYLNSASSNNLTGNLLQNLTTNEDSYDAGFVIRNQSNLNYIFDNNITEYGTVGIIVQHNSSFNQILNNTFNGININNRDSYSAQDVKDFPCSIKLVKLYKSYIGSSLEGSYSYNDIYGNFTSNNITISGNSFSNTDCFLQVDDFTNVSNDLSGYVFRSYATPNNLVGKTDLYLRNGFNNISRYDGTTIYSAYRSGYNGVYYSEIYQFSGYQYFKNLNGTYSNQTNLYNLTDALIYNTNLSIYGNSDISLNDGNINITLPPNNASYVLNIFNLTEGVSRENSPLSFSATSSISKTITSTLTDSIIATVIVNINGCPTAPTYNGVGTSYVTCENNQASFLLNITEGSNNILDLYVVTPESHKAGSSSNIINNSLNNTLEIPKKLSTLLPERYNNLLIKFVKHIKDYRFEWLTGIVIFIVSTMALQYLIDSNDK